MLISIHVLTIVLLIVAEVVAKRMNQSTEELSSEVLHTAFPQQPRTVNEGGGMSRNFVSVHPTFSKYWPYSISRWINS